MSELGEILASLGLEQYHDPLISEGFENWNTVQDITENDLDALGFKLGHRRKLQRYIASQRGVTGDQPLTSPYPETSGDRAGEGSASTFGEGQLERGSSTETKRKYRRHPKPDDNAPERPPSAYVLFSNAIREEIKGQDLSFTDIAKLVGQRWQSLSAAQREPFETKAGALKEQFNQQLAEYKKTDQYREYTQYLNDFKIKHGGTSTDGKRPKLEEESSAGSPVAATVSFTRSPDLREGSQGGPDPSQSQATPTDPLPTIQRSIYGSPRPNVTVLHPAGAGEARPYTTTPRMEPSGFHTAQSRDGNRIPSFASPLAGSGGPGGYFEAAARHDLPRSTTSLIGSTLLSPAENRSKPPLFHQDTTASTVSSIPSTLSYGSGSTGPLTTPLTPRDESWGPRPQGFETFNTQGKSWDVPRPIHPPFHSPQGPTFTGLQPLKMPDRSYGHPSEQNLRLPPPNASVPANPHDSHSLSIRAQQWPPHTQFSEQARASQQRGDQSQGPSRSEGISERIGEQTGSPLDVLANAVDAQRRDTHQT